MKMIRTLLLLLLLLKGLCVTAQKIPLWKSIPSRNNDRATSYTRIPEGEYELNLTNWKALLQEIKANKVVNATKSIQLPTSDGKIEEFIIWESSNFDPKLQEQYPLIQSFTGKGITDPSATIYLSSAPNGLQTMVLRKDHPTEFLEPIKGSTNHYALYRSDKKDKNNRPLLCTTEEKNIAHKIVNKSAAIKVSDRKFRTFRLALSCTGEYAAVFGGTKAGALAAMNATMTRVNGIFNKDLALKLVLIANNESVIYTDAAADPYTTVVNNNAPSSWNQELQNTLNAVIGSANYDIGHLFGASGGGGNAGCIGCVCDSGKGSAYTSPANGRPEGDTFDIDFVAHEMGHQLGANHTFSHELEGTGVNVEPGSGSTIMSYAGITDDYDVQKNADDYFAFASINQIQLNLANKTCPTSTALTSDLFTVNGGNDFIIPKSTPFVLKGTVSGTSTAAYTYVWEQNDAASSSSGANSIADPTKLDGPLFRSIKPTSSLSRYFPNLNQILSNQLTSTWESAPSIGRTLNFVFTARNNAAQGSGQTASDAVIVTTSNTIGPFEVTSQNTKDLSWTQGTNETITWNVNGSNTLAGATNVNIKLSTDGGLTYPTTLIANTTNDGTETIQVPNVQSVNCRIMIEPTNSIFYAVNKMPFAIGFTTVSTCNNYTFSTPIAIPDSQSSFTTRTIDIPADQGTIMDVNVQLAITHDYMSDIEIELVNPQKQVVRLLQRVCGASKTPLDLILDDAGTFLKCDSGAKQTVTAADLLSAFNGKDPAGTWTLKVRDAYDGDSGTITNAVLEICTQKATLDNTDFALENFKLFPNPSQGTFKIEFTNPANADVLLSVTDLVGRNVYQNRYKNITNFNDTIELNGIPSGIYLLKIESGNKKEIQKIVIN